MKKLFFFLSLSIGLLICGCDSCDNENPSVQLVNNGTGKADIQVKTSGGNTENINNILPGTASERRTFSFGSIEFTIAIQGVNENIIYSIEVFTCKDYTVTINSDNSVSSVANNRD